jgi:toxin YoeB
MHLEFRKQALEDLSFWKQNDRKKLLRIRDILNSIKREPYGGIGKPEKLKHDLAGLWSRRIDKEHRLVYKVEYSTIIVYQCRYHY